MSLFGASVRAHVVGVGGAGMSGLARLLVESGATVSGSDVADSVVLESLRSAGVSVRVGHDAAHDALATHVLWSPAIPEDNVELVAARERGATMLSRAEALGSLSETRSVVGLTGTHGKTTATSMMVHVVAAAGLDAGRLLGADVLGVGANGHWGIGDVLVEVDESYGTFALMHPRALGLLNVEADHLDHYGTLASLERAFAELIERTGGPVVGWHDDSGVRRVAALARRDVLFVGTADSNEWVVGDVLIARDGATFSLRGPDETMRVDLNVIGAHNVADAAVVAVLALQLGVSSEAVTVGLRRFQGAPRRFDRLGSWRGVDVYESYAHLPGEISAILASAHAAGYERVTAVFQPHRVTRTISLADDFAPAFDAATNVVVTDIYSAGEANPTGASGELVADALLRRGGVRTSYCASLADVPFELSRLHDVSDVILLLGAGDVASVANHLEGLG